MSLAECQPPGISWLAFDRKNSPDTDGPTRQKGLVLEQLVGLPELATG